VRIASRTPSLEVWSHHSKLPSHASCPTCCRAAVPFSGRRQTLTSHALAGFMVAAEHGSGGYDDSDLLVITPAAILLPFVVERARAALEELEEASLLPGCR